MTTLLTGLTTVSPASMVPTSSGNVYGVNGQQRGFVVLSGVTAKPIGVTAAPSITAASTASPQYFYVASIEVTSEGENYNSPPFVSVSGITGERAELDGTVVGKITFTTSASTFTSSPAVTISGGQASGAAANVIVRGSVSSVNLSASSAHYTAPPTVTFAARTGVTAIRDAQARATLVYASASATSGKIASVVITDCGLYEWSSSLLGSGVRPVSATVPAGFFGLSEFTPSLSVDCAGAINSVVATSGGTGYSSPPNVSFTSDGALKKGGGANAIAAVTGSTVSGYTLINFGNGYDGAVSASISSDQAEATAVMAPRLAGKYLCGVRYVRSDGTPGNFCSLVEVDCGERASSIVWNLTAVDLQDSGQSLAAAELWRTTGDQAVTLYRVATQTTAATSYTDGLPDAELSNPNRAGYDAIRILTEEGYTNAFRFGVPPSSMAVVTMFQDRAWYAVDTSGSEPNTIYFSEVDEPESVAADAQVIIQTNGRDGDFITGLMPFDGALYVGQSRNIVRLTVGGTPYADAAATPVAQRGLLNDRCWDRFEGVTYIVDSAGAYAFTGSGADPLSDSIGDYWATPLIDFSKSKWFFVQVNHSERVMRFYFVPVGSSAAYPDSALCYSLITRAWWLESYGQLLSAKATVDRNGRQCNLAGGAAAIYRLSEGSTDAGQSISYSLKTGNFPLNNDPKRSVRLTYTPVAGTLAARLYYNNSSSPRANAVATSRGDGFVTSTGSSEATLNMAPDRSPLATATGFAQLSLSGRIEDRSAGSDRCLSVELAGTRASGAPTIHSLEVEGAG